MILIYFLCSCVLFWQIYSCMLKRSGTSGVIHIYLNMICIWKSVRFSNRVTSPLRFHSSQLDSIHNCEMACYCWGHVFVTPYSNSNSGNFRSQIATLLYLRVNVFDLSTICLRLKDVVMFQKLGIEHEQDTLFFPPLFSSSCLLYSYSHIIVEAFKLSTVSGIR